MNKRKIKLKIESLRKSYLLEPDSLKRTKIEEQMMELILFTFGSVTEYYKYLEHE